MNLKLFTQAIIKYISGLILVSCLIFIPAGTINFTNAWIFIVLLFVPMFIVGIILMLKNPELLKLRLDAKEKQSEQKTVIAFSAVMFVSGFIIAGLNFRYSWIVMPNIIVYISAIIFIISYILYGIVLKQNTYLSRTIEVTNNQKVVDTGLYKLVRHPMYLTTLSLFLTIPLILGSIQAFIIFLIYPIIIIKRINNEEEVLAKDLKGYKEYMEKVKYKLIPYIW